jgi:eukaryotic-like serine/threonine-protein kinase
MAALQRRGQSGGATVLLVVVLAVVFLAAGVLAAVAIGGASRPAVTPAATPPMAVSGGGGVSPTPPSRDYAWLNRGQDDLLALSAGSNTPPPTGTATSATPASTGDAAPGGLTSGSVPPVAPPVSIAPNLVGKSLEEAKELLAQQQLQMVLKGKRYSSKPVGQIASQWPDAGAKVSDGTVYVSKSLGPEPEPEPAPAPRSSGGSRSGGCSGKCSNCHPGRTP